MRDCVATARHVPKHALTVTLYLLSLTDGHAPLIVVVSRPDLYTDAQTMAWIYDTYDGMHAGRNNRPVVTGKPLDMSGSVGRHEATARGCLYATQHLLSHGIVAGLDCDILIPAAYENQIRREAGIHILPDILANSGGVCVSYFEWVQNIENEHWDIEKVNGQLQKKMERAVDAVVQRWQQITSQASSSSKAATSDAAPDSSSDPSSLDLRTAALAVAIERVAKVAASRGIWP